MGNSFIYSCAHRGLESTRVRVEVDIANGLPRFSIVGLPDAAISEARERVRAAMKNSGFSFPRTRVTVNLAPASIKKQGPMYDLAIALSILRAEGRFSGDNQLNNLLVIGELALDGTLRPVRGALLAATLAKELNAKGLIVPSENAKEASSINGIAVYPTSSLAQVVTALEENTLVPYKRRTKSNITKQHDYDFKDIKGQEQAKRALTIAAAGGHNLFMNGPPGAGKTLLAKTLPSILPAMSPQESIDVTKIQSIAGLTKEKSVLVQSRPFRRPHHTCSPVALTGGGTDLRPGEITLAHHGVLFLDEFPEFTRKSIENLRQPLEDGEVTLARASGSVTYPAQFMLIAAANPCPCGFATDPKQACSCRPSQLTRYQQKASGPILDRFDLFVEVPRVKTDELNNLPSGPSSNDLRKQVSAARNIQLTRNAIVGAIYNQQLKQQHLSVICNLKKPETDFLKKAIDALSLSARAYARVLKVARTIADLGDSDNVQIEHLAEALQFRKTTT